MIVLTFFVEIVVALLISYGALVQSSLPKTVEFSFVLSNAVVETSSLFSLKLMFERSKLESLRDISVTRIGDTLSYGFLQTEEIN